MKFASVAGAAVVSVALAACGGSDKSDKGEEFAQDYKPLNAQLLAVGDDLARALATAKTTSNADTATEFRGFARDIGRVGDRIAALDPPADLEGDVGQMTRDIEAMEASMNEIAVQAGANNVLASRAAARRMVQQAAQLNEVQNRVAEATGAAKGRA